MFFANRVVHEERERKKAEVGLRKMVLPLIIVSKRRTGFVLICLLVVCTHGPVK